ncbi:MAG: hypothetical protein AAFX04_13825 [Pseudomonadota bacterium]
MRILLFLALLTFSFPAHAQNNDGCQAVLEYTGMEREFFWSKNIGRIYFANKNQSSDGLALAYKAFELDWSQGRQEVSTRFEEWSDEYMSQIDRVYAPAVSAWSECKRAAQNRLSLVPQIRGGNLYITLKKPFGVGIDYFGVSADQDYVACSDDLKSENLSLRRIDVSRSSAIKDIGTPLPDRAVTIACVRKGNALGPATVRIRTGPEVFTFDMPQMAGTLKTYHEGNNRVYDFGGCNNVSELVAAADFPRVVRLENVQVYGPWEPDSTGVVNVTVNGRERLANKSSKPEDANPSGGVTAGPSEIEIPAFVPVIVHMTGGISSGGTCQSGKSTGRIVVPY